MLRFLAGVGAALLLVAAGFLVWTGRAEREATVPKAPEARSADRSTPEVVHLAGASDQDREERRFGRYDADENGIITRTEMMETRRKPFQKLDSDGDGKLSFDEWAIGTAERFAKADADKSATLTATEFATTKRETKPKRCDC
jgi:hypothetical protein